MSDYLTDEERELKRQAEAATPGDWGYDANHTVAQVSDGDEWGVSICQSPSGLHHAPPSARTAADLRHIAAANPKAVLGLLARIEALSEVAKAVEFMTEDVAENGTCADCPYVSSARAKELLAIIRREKP